MIGRTHLHGFRKEVTMMKSSCIKRVIVTGIVVLAGAAVTRVYSHCQIPCGIYDDAARLKSIGEHIATIEKSMVQIVQLSAGEDKDMNQIVRWVHNKDRHADELAEIVTAYFMAQRIKPAAADSPKHKQYLRQLTLLHEMLVASMKCKQTTDLAHVEKLKKLLHEFTEAYS